MASLISPLYATYLETLPDIHPAGQSSDAASYSLPFSIKNRSPYFEMSSIILHCEYSTITWDLQTPKPHNTPMKLFRAVGKITTHSKQAGFQIAPGESVNFPCDASDAAKASLEGDKLPVTEIHVRINVGYHSQIGLIPISRHYDSPTFIWKKWQSGFQWHEGNIVQ